MSAIGSTSTTDAVANAVDAFRPILDRLGPLQRGCFCERSQQSRGDISWTCTSCLMENARAAIAAYDAEVKA
jgi:hypothetical protein